jgi:hypothetical protein
MRYIFSLAILLISLTSCKKNNNPDTPKAVADAFFNALKTGDSKAFAGIMPSWKDIENFLRMGPGSDDEKAMRIDMAKSRYETSKNYTEEMFMQLYRRGTQLQPNFWKEAVIVDYDGIVPKKGEEAGVKMEAAEVIIKIAFGKETKQLKVGEMIRPGNGKWLIMTEPRWL